MVNRMLARVVATLCTASFGVAANSGAIAAAPPLERGAPGDCFFVLTVRDVPGLMQRCQGLSIAKAAADSSMQPYMSSVKSALKQLGSATTSSFGFDLEKIGTYFKGQVLLALQLKKDDSKGEMLGYLLVDVSGNEGAVRGVLD